MKEIENSQASTQEIKKIKSSTYGLSAIPSGKNASIAAQDKRFERQLKKNAEREQRLLEFRASEAERDCQHEARMAQLLMSLESSSMQPFFAWGGLHNVSQPNSVMPSHLSCQLSNVT